MMLLDGGLLDASLTTINFGPLETIKPICISQDWPSILNDIWFRDVPKNTASYQFLDQFGEIWDGDHLSLPSQPRRDTTENDRQRLLPAPGVCGVLPMASPTGHAKRESTNKHVAFDLVDHSQPSFLNSFLSSRVLPDRQVELLLSEGSHKGIKRSLADAFEVDELDRSRKGGDSKKARGEATVEFAHGTMGSTAKTVRNVSACKDASVHDAAE
ncbi:hypothetical protein JX265_013696 [Neoarthrinium moseri]|uniref:Uncharacterized protein n=1 Tax=Neoarthrinium moseri TaxID=1658444 RepID=A0A9P9W830_9PEZI|nr:hypothetical protein JX265_013696 [Neoarthrinium moseri]